MAAQALYRQRDINSQEETCPRSCRKSMLEQETEPRFSKSIYFPGHWTSWVGTAPLKMWKMCTNISRTCSPSPKKEHQPKVSLVSSSNLLWVSPLCTQICMTSPSHQGGLKSGLASCQGGWQKLFSSPTANIPCCDNHCMQETLEKGHKGLNNIHVGK